MAEIMKKILSGEEVTQEQKEVLQNASIPELLEAVKELGLDEGIFLQACLEEV